MKHIFSKRVYCNDTDAGGVAYHGNYLGILDIARSDLLIENGFNFFDRHNNREFLVVVEANLRFKKPAKLGDLIDITTTCGDLSRASATAYQKVYKGDELLVEC